MESALSFAARENERFIEELKFFLKFPSISNNSENAKDVSECAEFLKEQFEIIGLNNVQIFKTEGHPIVYGDWLLAGEDKPTLLIYGHYDVQPVDPLELWTNPPFEPVIRNGRIYARGSADDKGQMFIHLKAIESILKQTGRLPVNIKLIAEGEEEISSVNLGSFVSENKELLKCDVAIVSDTAMYDEEHPSIGYALRGICYMQIEVTGPNRDLHSGQFGGSVGNPINALAEIISKLRNENGRILIDGFYDDVLQLTEMEKNTMQHLPFDENAYCKSLGIKKVSGEAGYSTLERIWARPTLDCNGIWGGFTGKGAKTVLPSKAYAKISMRLVAEQVPEKIEKLFKDYIKKISPDSVRVNVQSLHHGKPAKTPVDSEWVKAASSALKKSFQKEPVFIREGGSIPIVNTFEEQLGVSTVLLGFGLPDENAHSPDENFSLENFRKGIITAIIYYHELSKVKIKK